MNDMNYINEPIDVSTWKLEDQPIYPEGAKPKTSYFPPDDIQLPHIDPSRRYLYKRTSNAAPDQFWAEIVSYRISRYLNIEVPPCYPAFNSTTGTSGALVEWFYIDNKARFLHGSDFFVRRIPGFDIRRGTQHNLTDILKICHLLERITTQAAQQFDTDILSYWGETIVFDALIGNSDRHQNNWGAIMEILGPLNVRTRLSPLFDNGTSMGNERFLSKLDQWNDARFNSYIDNGRHHMRIKVDDATRAQHFELVKHYVLTYPQVKPHLHDMIRGFSLDRLLQELHALMAIELPERLTEKRVFYYMKLISMRLERLKAILQ